MSLRLLLAALSLAVLVMGVPARAQDSDEPTDIQDVVFLGESRPVVLRLHIRVDGKSFTVAWQDYITGLFKYLDRNDDAVLSKAEAERAPKAQTLLQQMRNGGYFFLNQGSNATMAEYRSSDEDKVTLEEFTSYYFGGGAGPIQVNVGNRPGGNLDELNQALFMLLDRKATGRLTREGVADAERLIARLDDSDDETLEYREILPSFNPFANQAQMQAMQRGGPAPIDNSPFIVIPPGDSVRLQLANQLLQRYDQDKNKRLSRTEISLDQQLWNEIDTNNDRELDGLELIRLLKRSPLVELKVTLGKNADKAAVTSFRAKREGTFLNVALRDNGHEGLVLRDGNTEVDLRRVDALPTPGMNNVRQFFVQQFKNVDTKQKGHIDKEEVKDPQLQYLRFVFDVADRDEDAKLTMKEIDAYLDLQARSSNCYLMLAYTDDGQGLFEKLDVNRDGRLGIRELRTAWERLAVHDREAKGYVAKSDIPRQFQVTFSQGQPINNAAQRAVLLQQADPYGPPVPVVPVSTRGPVWYRKMDANGDGDVSVREFLGNKEAFRGIDSNGDGLISLEEATKAEIATRKRE